MTLKLATVIADYEVKIDSTGQVVSIFRVEGRDYYVCDLNELDLPDQIKLLKKIKESKNETCNSRRPSV